MARNRGEIAAGEGSSSTSRLQRWIVAAACAIICAIALPGCGLQTIIYYDSPTVSFTNQLLSIDHDASNDAADYFLGYEIYYRVFEDEDMAKNIGSAIYSASLSTTTSPDYLLTQLTSGNFSSYSGQVFYKMTDQYGYETTPLFLRSGGTEYYIYISASSDWTYRVGSGTATAINRTSSLSSGGIRSFYEVDAGDTWLAVDVDYEGEPVYRETTLYLVAFVVAYGFDLSSDVPTIYSMPAVFYNQSTGYYTVPFTAH